MDNPEIQATVDKTQNEDKQSIHTTIKTKKRSNMLMVCKGNYHLNCADDIFRRMWLSFIKIKEIITSFFS